MGAAGSSTLPAHLELLRLDDRWMAVESLAIADIFRAGLIAAKDCDDEPPSLSSDAAAIVLVQLDLASLHSLACTCHAAHAAAREIRSCFSEATFRTVCERHGWSSSSLADVGIHIAARHFTPCPPWLSRLSEKLRLPHQHHMRRGVVAKVLAVMGPLDERRSRFVQRLSYRRLFAAHVNFGIAEGDSLITADDVAELRKLRGLQAYMFAEGWAGSGAEDGPLLYQHAIEHAIEGRIELA